MKAPIGFKTAEPAYTDGIVDRFYRPLVAAGIAPVVMSIDSAGHCYDVWQLVAGTPLQDKAVMHFRRTGDAAAGQPNGMDVPDYDADPVADANRLYDWHVSRWPRELPADRVWTQFTNEPRKEAHDWLARHALQLCRRALADGRRITLFGWAAGTPEPEAWQTAAAAALLALLRQYPERLAIAVNEYAYKEDTLDAPALIGRWQAIPRPWPTVFITEFGWTYNAAPASEQAIPQILDAYRAWYAHPNVKGLALWTLDRGRGGRDLPRIVNGYMNGLAAAIAATDFPAPSEPPTPPTPRPPAPAAPKIADISKWQGRIDPARMKAAGINAVIPRASYGVTRDPAVDGYLTQLQAAALPVPAVYHYYEPRRPWRDQLNVLLTVMRAHGINRAVIDLEEMTFPDPNAAVLEAAVAEDEDLPPEERRERNRQIMIDLGIDPLQTRHVYNTLEATDTVRPDVAEDVRQFLEALDREMPLADRRHHAIYTNWSYWVNIIGAPGWGARYDLWIAAWTTAAKPAVPTPWATWTLWQHTSSAAGPAHGVQSARLDLNRFNGTATAFADWCAAALMPAPRPDTLAITLRQAAAALPSYVEHPEFALAASIIAAKHQVDSPEASATDNGVAYVLQRGLDPRTGDRHIHYCRVGEYATVSTLPVRPPAGDKPSTGAIDLLPYLKGDGRLYQMEIHTPDGQHSQQMQTVARDGRFLQLKNHQWEELWADNQSIYRGTDTSCADDTYYTLRDNILTYGSRWCPRLWQPGGVYERNPIVTYYWKATGAPRTDAAHRAGPHRTWLRFAAHHPTYLIGGILLRDVIELHWLGTPTATQPLETYLYARGYGLVAWTSADRRFSRIVEQFEPGEREPMQPEPIAYLNR